MLKKSAFVTLTFRTRPEDWRTNSWLEVASDASDMWSLLVRVVSYTGWRWTWQGTPKLRHLAYSAVMAEEQTLPAIEEESRRLLEAAAAAGLEIRLTGGLAISA